MIRLILLAAACAVAASPAFAQSAGSQDGVQFVPRYAFHMDAEHLNTDDARFVWDADVGGDVDLIDYGSGRVTFLMNYQVVLGDQLRRFDANQGNYQLDGFTSMRVGGSEIAAAFHHVSRHLSDRFKRPPVDWNMLGARILKRGDIGKFAVDSHADLSAVLSKSLVDYRWEAAGDASAIYRLRSGVGLVTGGGLRVVGVDGTRDRGTQLGFRAEGGVRIDGGAGAVELFAGVERRIDPYPLEASTNTWFTTGLRLLSR